VVVVHFKTADKLLSASNALFRDYAGDLNALNGVAADGSDLERRVKQLGKGIGDVTVNIFLREMRGVWPKTQPLPSERTVQAAKPLRLVDVYLSDPTHILQALRAASREDSSTVEDFQEFEAALERYGAALQRKGMPGRDNRPRRNCS
jgi:hypothetical protein